MHDLLALEVESDSSLDNQTTYFKKLENRVKPTSLLFFLKTVHFISSVSTLKVGYGILFNISNRNFDI